MLSAILYLLRQYYDNWQFHGVQLLKMYLSWALLFSLSNVVPFMISCSIMTRLLSLDLFPSSLPFITFLICPSPFIIWPNQLLFLLEIVSTRLRFSSTDWNTFSFVCFSFQLIFNILLHINISKEFKRQMSSFLCVHVSHSYNATYHKHFTIVFFKFQFYIFHKQFFPIIERRFCLRNSRFYFCLTFSIFCYPSWKIFESDDLFQHLPFNKNLRFFLPFFVITIIFFVDMLVFIFWLFPYSRWRMLPY